MPTIPVRHDFRGGVISTASPEQHEWRYPGAYQASAVIGQRRAYPYHQPIISIEQFRIYVTNTQYVEISPNDLFIQNTERYVEVVSLAITSSGLFNALIIPNVGLATPTLQMAYTYGRRLRVLDEPISAAEGNTLYRAENQWWFVDTDNPVNVYVNGVLKTPTTDYTYNASEGTVLFVSPPGAEDEPGEVSVTLDYTYRLPWEIREATSLIARYELGEARLSAKGMLGLESIKIAELSLSRPRRLRTGSSGGPVTKDNLDDAVPEAAALLTGYKQWRAAA